MGGDINVTGAGASVFGSDTELAAGVGIGFKFGKTSSLEIEYTIPEVKSADVDFLSVGFHFPF